MIREIAEIQRGFVELGFDPRADAPGIPRHVPDGSYDVPFRGETVRVVVTDGRMDIQFGDGAKAVDEFRQGTDAREWARAFLRYYEQSDDKAGFLDEGNLIGWFANAMCAVRDEERRKLDTAADA